MSSSRRAVERNTGRGSEDRRARDDRQPARGRDRDRSPAAYPSTDSKAESSRTERADRLLAAERGFSRAQVREEREAFIAQIRDLSQQLRLAHEATRLAHEKARIDAATAAHYATQQTVRAITEVRAHAETVTQALERRAAHAETTACVLELRLQQTDEKASEATNKFNNEQALRLQAEHGIRRQTIIIKKLQDQVNNQMLSIKDLHGLIPRTESVVAPRSSRPHYSFLGGRPRTPSTPSPAGRSGSHRPR